MGGLAITLLVVVVVSTAAVAWFTLTHHSRAAAGRTSRAYDADGEDDNLARQHGATYQRRQHHPRRHTRRPGQPLSLAGAYSTDPVVVLETISAYSDWLFAHPNPALLDNYMLPSSRNYAGVKAELTTLQTNGWHARPSVSAIVWIKSQGPFAPGVGLVNDHPSYVGTGVKIVIDDTPRSSDVLNLENQVVASLHNRPQEMLGVSLAQGSDGQFRISDIAAYNPAGGLAAFES